MPARSIGGCARVKLACAASVLGSGVARRSGEPIARMRAVRVLLLGAQEEIWVWYIGVVEGPRAQ